MNVSMIKVGETQSMQFPSAANAQPSDGPFQLKANEKADCLVDVYEDIDPSKQKRTNKTKIQLIAEISNISILPTTDPSKFKLSDLQKIATKLNLPIQKNIDKKRITKGWSGQPKGLIQVLWERGWIDVNNISEYKLAAKNEDGENVPEYSLVELMASCHDFAEEISELEAVGEKLGVNVVITTKYHAEIAGEGIEYAWGVAKSAYRKMKLSQKKGYENFMKAVRECVSPGNVLTIVNVRKFSKRARSYMQAYYHLGQIHFKQSQPNNDLQSNSQPNSKSIAENITFEKIEKLAKDIKTHRCMLDIDTGFIVDLTKK